jgi:BCD family chlorophyll transporter-like MFS transporter
MRTNAGMLFGRRAAHGFGWLSIIRLGLVQAALGSIVVLTTSTLNRVMVVELSLAAIVPGFLVGLHYAIQLSRPLFGHGSDVSRAGRSLWIIGGMALLAVAGTAAAATTHVFEQSFALGLGLAALAYAFIGLGIGASGTSLLALLASRTAPARRPAAATIVWIMMIAGIVVTAATTGSLLDPYSHGRLVTITAITGTIAVLVTIIALAGLERVAEIGGETASDDAPSSFRERLAETWADDEARLFTVFIFLSMLAYATQDLIMEPFAGLIFGFTPGQSTQLSGTQHAGILIGMVLVGVIGTLPFGRSPRVLKAFTLAGCAGSALALAALSIGAFTPGWPLAVNVATLGFFNGMFTIAAIGAMMSLAGKSRAEGRGAREGIRMGVWGAAQAIAFGLGGFSGTVAVDALRALTGDTALSFATVFAFEALLFLASAAIALKITMPGALPQARPGATTAGPLDAGLQPAE